jgi:hypothetical protein
VRYPSREEVAAWSIGLPVGASVERCDAGEPWMPATIVDCPAEYTKWGAACLWITHAARGGRPANEAMDAMGVPRSTREALERHAKAPQWATSEDFQAWSASVGFVSDDDATKASPVFDVQAPEHFGYLTVAAMTRTGR